MLAPGLSFAVIWVDISERPDLQILAEKDTLADGFSTCTWFYDSPGKQNMRMGLRVEMRQPVHFVIALAFNVRQYVDQLTTIGQDGSFWIMPGPPPSHLASSIEMNPTTIIEQVVSSKPTKRVCGYQVQRQRRQASKEAKTIRAAQAKAARTARPPTGVT